MHFLPGLINPEKPLCRYSIGKKLSKVNTLAFFPQGFLKDTVGKLARGGKIRSGGCHVFENTIALANARRNGTDREDVVGREGSLSDDWQSII
jgi:hypothetical protein